MKRYFALIALAGATLPAATTHAAAPDVRYAPAPAWALPPPARTEAPTPPDAPGRLIYADTQIHLGPAGEETFSAYRLKLLKPEALPAGNITVAWNPSAGEATVHYLRIIRDGQTIDVLRATKFRVIQREGGLEQSMLDGQLTATLQTPGLQVGDEIEFAATIRRRDPTLGDHSFGLTQFPLQGTPGAFRYRLLWPEARPVTLRASKDMPQSMPTIAKGEMVVSYEVRDPSGVIVAEDAPPRYNIRRLIEYSDFATWRGVSGAIWPLFDKAARLAPTSAIRAEAARIAASTSDPVERAQAALRLVQERIRYVYVGLDGGNYTPAAADVTWERRFGDCKGKTVLLLALLRELGVSAEAMLVDAKGSDGTNEHLPTPGLFDHVLVRARIGGRSYWLDGTRLGDRYLDVLPPPSFRWALPLESNGADLEAVPAVPFALPQLVAVIDVDASAGFDKPAKAMVRHVLRGEEAYVIRSKLAAMSADDADRAIRGYWRQQMDWVEPDKVSWRYEDRSAALILSLTGEGKPSWEGNDMAGRSLTIYGAGFIPPDQMKRPKEQDQTAPWATEFPRFRCWATTVRLPAPAARWRWTYLADPVNRTLGGIGYWRAAGLRDNVMRTVMSRQTLVPEISAVEAKSVNDQIADFNNKMSSVYEEAIGSGGTRKVKVDPLPFTDDADWLSSAGACTAPVAAGPVMTGARAK